MDPGAAGRALFEKMKAPHAELDRKQQPDTLKYKFPNQTAALCTVILAALAAVALISWGGVNIADDHGIAQRIWIPISLTLAIVIFLAAMVYLIRTTKGKPVPNPLRYTIFYLLGILLFVAMIVFPLAGSSAFFFQAASWNDAVSAFVGSVSLLLVIYVALEVDKRFSDYTVRSGEREKSRNASRELLTDARVQLALQMLDPDMNGSRFARGVDPLPARPNWRLNMYTSDTNLAANFNDWWNAKTGTLRFRPQLINLVLSNGLPPKADIFHIWKVWNKGKTVAPDTSLDRFLLPSHFLQAIQFVDERDLFEFPYCHDLLHHLFRIWEEVSIDIRFTLEHNIKRDRIRSFVNPEYLDSSFMSWVAKFFRGVVEYEPNRGAQPALVLDLRFRDIFWNRYRHIALLFTTEWLSTLSLSSPGSLWGSVGLPVGTWLPNSVGYEGGPTLQMHLKDKEKDRPRTVKVHKQDTNNNDVWVPTNVDFPFYALRKVDQDPLIGADGHSLLQQIVLEPGDWIVIPNEDRKSVSWKFDYGPQHHPQPLFLPADGNAKQAFEQSIFSWSQLDERKNKFYLSVRHPFMPTEDVVLQEDPDTSDNILEADSPPAAPGRKHAAHPGAGAVRLSELGEMRLALRIQNKEGDPEGVVVCASMVA